MKKALLATAVAGMASALAINVNAADIRWNGFASFTGGINLDKAQRADAESSEIDLYGYDDDFDFRPETKLALQASSDLGNGLSVTAQAIARGADDYQAEFEWAFVSYDFGDASRVNIGRLRIPFFLYSDFLDVGYAYPWIRPPESVYDLFTSTMDGVNVQLNGAMGSWDSSLQLVGGRQTDDLLIGGNPGVGELINIFGGAWTVNNDWLTLRAAYYQAQLTLEIDNPALNGLLDTLRCPSGNPLACGPTFDEQADNIAIEDDTGAFAGVGFKVDKNDWLFGAEYTLITVDDAFLGDQTSGYVMLGRRFNNLTFHVTYEMEEVEKVEGLSDGVPVPLLAAGIEATAASTQDKNNTFTVGMRYDFHPSAAFKIDFTQRDWDSSRTLDVDGSTQELRFSIDTVF